MLPLAAAKDNNNKGEEEYKDDKPPMTLAEYSQREEEASNRLMNRLLLPSKLGHANNAAAFLFVIIGYLLNFFGYTYMKDSNGNFCVNTLDATLFQDKINKSSRR